MAIKKSGRFYLNVFWLFIAVPLISIASLFILISAGWMGFMPTFEDLENPQKNIASEIISEDDEILGTFYYENRTFVSYNKISPNMYNALVATEDIRYFKHSGIDYRGLARVFVKSILLQSNSGGGSTITQQLAKNLFPRPSNLDSSFLNNRINLFINKF